MDRFATLFKKLKEKKEGAFMPFAVGCDPDFDTSLSIFETMIENGADVIEIGFPFSDPMIDGETILRGDVRALKSGATPDDAFRIIKEIRKFSDVPIMPLVYYNIVLQRGIEKFYKDCKDAGVDAVLIADCPIEESEEVHKCAMDNEINQIYFATHTTTDERLKKTLSLVSGFIYVVSLHGATGVREKLEEGLEALIKNLHSKTDVPLCVGFGISKPEHVRAVMKAGADGVIVGSAIERIIEANLNNKKKMLDEIGKYVKGMKETTIIKN